MAEFRSTSRPPEEPRTLAETAAEAGKRATETAWEYGEEALERTADAAKAGRDTILEHPIATLAVVAGLAFAIGALWKMGTSQRQSAYDGLLARLSDLQRQAGRTWH